MGPFNHRFAEQNEHDDMHNRHEQEFQLRSHYDEEDSSPSSFEEYPTPQTQSRGDHTIRNLGFFKEQERQFSQNEDEEEWQERQSPINFVLIVGIFVALCLIGWLGYRWANQSSSGTPPLITADPTPFKVRPEHPGGMVIPHQDKLVYGRLSPSQAPQVEHLLPAPEQLLTPPPPTPPPGPPPSYPQPQTFVDANGQIYYAYPVPSHPAAPGAVPPAPPQQPAPIPAEQMAPPYPSASYPYGQAPVLPPSERAYPAPSAAEGYGPYQGYPSPAVTPSPSAPFSQPSDVPAASRPSLPPPLPPLPEAAPRQTLDQLIEQEMANSPVENSKNSLKDKEKVKGSGGPYKLQVATLDSESAAKKEALRIKNIDPNLFRDKKLSTQAVESMGGKKIYRVLVNGFATPNAAAQFSNKLKIHKVKGIVLHQPT